MGRKGVSEGMRVNTLDSCPHGCAFHDADEVTHAERQISFRRTGNCGTDQRHQLGLSLFARYSGDRSKTFLVLDAWTVAIGVFAPLPLPPCAGFILVWFHLPDAEILRGTVSLEQKTLLPVAQAGEERFLCVPS